MAAQPERTTPPTGGRPRVSIVVLTYNAAGWVERCLRSVHSWTDVPYELIVVDNGSGPETLTAIDAYRGAPGVTVITNGRNLGFARASNIGIGQAAGELVLLLNSDVIVTPRWLSNLVAPLDARPEVAATGPRTNHGAGIQGGIFLRSLAEPDVCEFAERFNRRDPERWREAARLSGFALLLRRSVLDEVGAFDERFEVGTAEDRELCDRIRAAGHELLCAGDCFVLHAGHASFLENRINFKHRHNLNRIAYASTTGDGERPSRETPTSDRLPAEDALELEDDVVITVEAGAKYLVHDRTLHPISQMDAVRLLPYPVRKEPLEAAAIRGHPVGDPIFFVRSWGPTVYLLALGRRHPLTGSEDRIAELEGITVLLPEQLEAIPEAEPLEL